MKPINPQNPFIKLISNLSIFLAGVVVIFFMAYVAVDGNFTIKVGCLMIGLIASLTAFLYDAPLGVLLSLFAVIGMVSAGESYLPQTLISCVAGFGLGAFSSLIYRLDQTGVVNGNHS